MALNKPNHSFQQNRFGHKLEASSAPPNAEQQTVKFSDAVRRRIRKGSPESQKLTDGLADGCFIIMRKLKGHRVQDFSGNNLNEPMYASQYFQLLKYINWENEETKRMYDKGNPKR